MSTTVDNRVVSMQFDNKNFERNVQTSLSTLDKLKRSLNLKGAAKSFGSIDTSVKKVNIAPLSNAVETVKLKFSALEVMAVTALTNITNSAVNAGKRLVSAFTIDPIKSGFQEYETQINAIQTILANTESKGTTLDDVNNALDTLNKYADKTIYNFTEMTRNIGTFTAAGIDLETSVTAIQGIANLAAVSGSTSQQASTAMYQLSQALASGTVKLMDWNSVVNAGMGGQVFQDALKETARVHGIAIDDMIKDEGSFRETLSKGWLTSEILTETLQKFTLTTEGLTDAQIEQNKAMLKSKGYSDEQIENIFKLGETATDAATKVKTFTQLMDTLKEAAQSGWTETWEILVGDFDEAKELWTKISDTFGEMIGNSAEKRNKFLSKVFSGSTWDELVEKLNDAGVETKDFNAALAETLQENGINVDSLVDKYGSLENAFKKGAVSSKYLKEALKTLNTTSKETLDFSGSEEYIKKKGKMQTGFRGESVNEIEKALKQLGYNFKGKDGVDYGEDGYYGTLTADAVKAFQKDKGLKVTGIVDEATLNALKEASATTKELDESVWDLVDGVNNLGGREVLIEALSNAFDALMSFIKPIKEAFESVFSISPDSVFKALEGFRDFTASLKLNEESSEKLKSTFEGLFSAIKLVGNFIASVAKGILSLLSNFTGLGASILGVTGTLGGWITNLRKSAEESDIFGKAIGTVVEFLQNGIDKIKEFVAKTKEKVGGSGWETFLNILKGIWGFIQKLGTKIIEVGRSIGKAFANIFRNGDIKTGLDLFNGGVFAAILLGIKKFIGNISDVFDGAGGLLEGVTGILDGVKGCLEAWQQDLKANALLKLAGAIGILALSILVISSVDPEKLASSLGAITVLFADLMGSLAVFTKLDSKGLKGVTKAITIMIGMSVAVLILASALKKLADLSWEEIAKGLVGVAGLMAELGLVVLAMGKMGKSGMKGAAQIVVFAFAIKILASVCKDLSSLSWEELGKGLAGVGGLLAGVALFLRTAKFGGKAISTALGIIALSAAIKVLASACKDFASMYWEEIGKGLASIGALLLALSLFTRLTGNAKKVISTGLALVLIGASMKIFASAVKDFSQMSWDEIGRGLLAMAGALVAVTLALRFMPKNTMKIGIGLVVVSSAMLILAKAMSKMGGMSWEEIGKGLVSLGGAIAILAIGLNAMNGTLAGSAALIIAAGAMAILTPVLKTLGAMSWEAIAKGLVVLAGAFAVIGIAGALLAPVLPAILGLAGAMALLGVGVLALGAGLVVAAAGITALSLALSTGATVIVAALSAIVIGFIELIPAIITGICEGIANSVTAIGEALKALVLVAIDVLISCIPSIVDGALKLITEVLSALATYTPQIVDSLLQFVIGVINGLAIRMPELIQAALNLLASFFAGITEAFANMDTSVLIDAAIGMGIVAAIMGVCSLLAPLVPGAITGVLGVGAVVAELAVVLAAIGALAQIPGLDWLVGEGGELLQTIGTALGGFVGGLVGGLVGGVMEGVTGSLPAVATNLSTFMTNLQPFIDGAQKLDASMLEGVSTLVGIITAITAANLLSSITSFITGGSSISTFGEQLVPFGQAIADFAGVVTGINTEAITAAAVAAQGLTAVANAIPAEGGVFQKFSGERDLSSFGTQLVSFGSGMKSFADSVAGIDTGAITAAATAAQGLADVANAIPAEGGIFQKFSGERDLSSFGTQLVSFGSGIKSFADSVAGIDTAAIVAAATASQSLSELANNIPAEGGIIQKFTGEHDLGTFGSQIGAFGEGMKTFSDKVAGLDVAAVGAATEAAVKLSAMANSIPDQGGFFSWFTGSQDLSTFGTQVTKFGEGIKGYADAVAGIDVSSVDSATAAAVALGSMASSLPDGESIDKIKWLGEKLKDFGKGIGDFSDNVAGIDGSAATSAVNVARSISSMARFLPDSTAIDNLKNFGGKLKALGTGIKDFSAEVSGISLSEPIKEIDGLIASLSKISAADLEGANSLSTTLKKISRDSINNFVNTFADAKGRVLNAAKSLMDSAIHGFKVKEASVTKAIKSIATKCASELKSKQSEFNSAGKYLVEGFSDGISANTFMAKAQAVAMAEAALAAAKAVLKINSPSKVFMKVGQSVPEGFAMGIDKLGSMVVDSSTAMADTALAGTKSAISRISDIVNSGIDSQPTIRPVVDLTDVASGASAIDGMLSMSPSIDTMAKVQGISASMNSRQNGSNNDVISAIHDLGSKLGNMTGNTYNVNGVTYDDGSNISDAVKSLIRAARVERRV